MRGLEHLTADDRAPDADVADGERVHVERRIFQHGEVGEFAGLDGADLVVHVQLERRTERGGLQRLVGVIFSYSPSTRPLGVSRLTAHHIVIRWPMGVTPESVWNDSGTRFSKAVRQAHIPRVRSGPIVCS